MKEIMKTIISILTVLIPIHLYGADRVWNNQGEDNGTVHSLGNGKMLVYETGPDVTTLYPGPYTSPSLYKLLLEDKRLVEVNSERESGSAIWHHSVTVDGTILGKMTDFVDADLPCLVRHLNLEKGMRFRLELIPDLQVQPVNTEGGGKLYNRNIFSINF
jgi:hypothetical protein